jgi:hypothetical protein
MIHQLKTKPGYFDDIAKGLKPFEVRDNDRDFRVGDFLALNEYDEAEKETGRCMLVEASYILNDREFCPEGKVIIGITPCCITVHGDGGSYLTAGNKCSCEEIVRNHEIT